MANHSPPSSTEPQLWARLLRQTPPIFRLYESYRMVPPRADLMTRLLAGRIWVELHGKPRHVWAAHFEVLLGLGSRSIAVCSAPKGLWC